MCEVTCVSGPRGPGMPTPGLEGSPRTVLTWSASPAHDAYACDSVCVVHRRPDFHTVQIVTFQTEAGWNARPVEATGRVTDETYSEREVRTVKAPSGATEAAPRSADTPSCAPSVSACIFFASSPLVTSSRDETERLL